MALEQFRVVRPDGVMHVVDVEQISLDGYRVSSEWGTERRLAATARVAVERHAAWYIGVAEIRGPGESTTAELLASAEAETARLRAELAERVTAHEHTLGLLVQGTAIVKSLQADVQRWRTALLATAPECPQCYRLATWERLGEEDTDDDETVLDIACDTHRAFGGRWFERANGAPLDVPAAFVVGVPVFDEGVEGDVWALPVRLRMRRQAASIAWSFHLLDADVTFHTAVDRLIEKVRAKTGLPVLIGTPE